MFIAMKRVSAVDVMMTAIQLEVKFLKQSKWLKGVHLQLYKNFAFIKRAQWSLTCDRFRWSKHLSKRGVEPLRLLVNVTDNGSS